jgi:hypothetical protein
VQGFGLATGAIKDSAAISRTKVDGHALGKLATQFRKLADVHVEAVLAADDDHASIIG